MNKMLEALKGYMDRNGHPYRILGRGKGPHVRSRFGAADTHLEHVDLILRGTDEGVDVITLLPIRANPRTQGEVGDYIDFLNEKHASERGDFLMEAEDGEIRFVCGVPCRAEDIGEGRAFAEGFDLALKRMNRYGDNLLRLCLGLSTAYAEEKRWADGE